MIPIRPIRRVLVVDDDKFVNFALCHAIETGDFEAVSAADPEEGMNRLREYAAKFDMLITDYEMPRMNGVEFTAMVRKKFPRLFIAGMSGHAGIGNEFISAGANAFLQKPFGSEQILELVAGLEQQVR